MNRDKKVITGSKFSLFHDIILFDHFSGIELYHLGLFVPLNGKALFLGHFFVVWQHNRGIKGLYSMCYTTCQTLHVETQEIVGNGLALSKFHLNPSFF